MTAAGRGADGHPSLSAASSFAPGADVELEEYACDRCISTVFIVTNSSWAIWRLVRPSTARLATRRSLAVSDAGAAEALAPGARAGGAQLVPRAVAEAGRAGAVGEVDRGPQWLARQGPVSRSPPRGAQLDERREQGDPGLRPLRLADRLLQQADRLIAIVLA